MEKEKLKNSSKKRFKLKAKAPVAPPAVASPGAVAPTFLLGQGAGEGLLGRQVRSGGGLAREALLGLALPAVPVSLLPVLLNRTRGGQGEIGVSERLRNESF